MKYNKLFLVLLVLVGLLAIAPMGFAQQDAVAGVELASPAAVTELYGDVSIEGSAAVPGMVYYYLEVLPMHDDLTIDEDTPWLPLTVAIESPVVDGELASIDTNRISDGVYTLRLTVNTADGQTYHDQVAPIRVSNERFAELLGETDEGQAVQLPLVPGDSTPIPSEVTVTSFQPGQTSPNVRRCDIVDNSRCPIIDHLDRNESAVVVATGNRNPGWLKIRLNSGHTGWISTSVVNIEGDPSTLPSEAPPEPLPPAPAPAPTQPPATGGAFPTSLAIEGGRAVCNETFNVQINISNTTNAVVGGGQVSLQDVNLGTGEVTASGYASFPNLNPGTNYVAVIPINTSVHYNERHELQARAGGREARLQYTLERGNCNRDGNDNNNDDDDNSGQSTALNCRLTSDIGTFEAYGNPGGEVVAVIESSEITGEDKTEAQGLTWYRATYLDTVVWIPVVGYVSTSGDC